MSKFIDITGKKYNMLTVIKRLESTKEGVTRWLCKCDCGNTTIVRGCNLKSGAVKSCGCLSKITKPTLTHGMSKSRIYSIYCGIKSRCKNKNGKAYRNYGERKISICKEWDEDFLCFYKWAIENGYNDNLTIERIDVDGNYEPKNCKWIKMKEQYYNKRNTIKYKGKCLSQICKEYSMPYNTVYRRITVGKMSIEEALAKPIMTQKRNKLCKRR